MLRSQNTSDDNLERLAESMNKVIMGGEAVPGSWNETVLRPLPNTTAHVRCLQAANNLQMQASPQTGVCKVLREIQGKQVLAKRGVCKPPTIFR